MDKMTIMAIAAGAVILLIIFASAMFRLRPRKLNTKDFQRKWRDLQKLCSNKETWPLAIINADKLLDEALKKLRYRGKTMGERLVSAQRSLSDNDSAWYGHKLRNKLVHEDEVKLKKTNVKDALMGIRQALKDLGALR
jgi:hypothetical protein